jgi:pyruvate dehydrogenase E2 component (dihydrolipoamide acetyltransferase)
MIEEIRLPEISENVETGDVTKVLVSEGDTVAVDQPLVELETEKAVFEVPSTVAGRVVEILVAAGDTINVGQTIAKIESGADAGAETATVEPADKPEPAPEESESAEPADKPEPAPEESESAEPADKSEPAPEESESAESADKSEPAPAESESAQESPAPPSDKGPPPAAAPSVRRLAREIGVNIRLVKGSGTGGRISADDVKRYAKGVIAGAATQADGAATQAPRPLPDFSRWGEVERRPMSKVRRITAETMAAAWTTIPSVTQYDKADITELEAARKKFGKRAEEAGGKLTMTAILLKVCAGALKNFPEFNSSIDMSASEIVYKKYFNIGVAVDTDRGLLVPVIRNVDCKSIVDISVELTQVAEKARNKKIKPDDLEGGNFTISNLGGIGGTYFSPIVYSPEVAILGVSRADKRPRWNGEKFEPRLMMPLSLSYDHRVIDGASAARLVRWICDALEDPMVLALEG